MPHRVAQLLRPATGNFTHKHAAISRSRNASAESSDSEDHAVSGIHDLTAALKKHHRLSLHFGKGSKDHHMGFFNHHHFTSGSTPAAATIDWSIESPPIVFHGNAQESSGALVSGLMFLHVKEESVEVDSFNASLKIHTTQKRPFHAHCHDCQHQYTELKTWNLLAHSTTLHRGKHSFPFSILLPGNLPASMDSPVLSIAYEFKAEAMFARNPFASSSSLTPAKFERVLSVKRSIPSPDVPHRSVRVFPPTNIKADAEYSTVIYPNSTNKLTLRMDGLTNAIEGVNMIDVWKLKKVTWRLEETLKTRAPACKSHAAVITELGGDDDSKNSLPRVETRCLGEKHYHDGWKSDYNSNGGHVEFEFDYSVNKPKSKGHKGDSKSACDVKTEQGTEVSHSLLVELIVSKEHGTEGKAQFASPTGTGRILRMHFNVVLTEYPGLGVSWDNETPPTYQDVPPSPPSYPMACPDSPLMQDNLELIDGGSTTPELQERPSYDFTE